MFATILALAAALPLGAAAPSPPSSFQVDTIPTSQGDLKITFIGHGTLMLRCGPTVVHVDPVSRYANYARLPKADVILVTHEHFDHLDAASIGKLTKADTAIMATPACVEKLKRGVVMKNGDVKSVKGLKIEAVAAYNVVHQRSPGKPFHPKGVGNGYVITFGGKRIYVAGDTENIPEMAKLGAIDVAFLPMNLPYTMTPEMVAAAAATIRPKILYPYHFGKTDTSKLVKLLKDARDIEVRIRRME